jgi:hypothetical protein
MQVGAFGLLSQWMGLLRNVCSDGFGGEPQVVERHPVPYNTCIFASGHSVVLFEQRQLLYESFLASMWIQY